MREKSKNRGMILFCMIFLVAGIVLVGMAVLIYFNNSSFKNRAVKIPATIERIDSYTTTRKTNRGTRTKTNHNVYVSYEFNGTPYNNIHLRSYTSSMYEGKAITILCDPHNPTDVDVEGMIYFPVILLAVMGVIFGTIGFVPTMILVKKKNKKKKLMTNGKVIYAVVDDVARNLSFAVNGVNPYRIRCSYTDGLRTYEFVSENMWDNPEEDFPVGSSIRVYVDSNDYGKYYVDSYNRVSDYA